MRRETSLRSRLQCCTDMTVLIGVYYAPLPSHQLYILYKLYSLIISIINCIYCMNWTPWPVCTRWLYSHTVVNNIYCVNCIPLLLSTVYDVHGLLINTSMNGQTLCRSKLARCDSSSSVFQMSGRRRRRLPTSLTIAPGRFHFRNYSQPTEDDKDWLRVCDPALREAVISICFARI